MDKKQKIVIKNMISLSDVLANALDDRYNKLSDKLKNLELSHNRKYQLLQDIEKKLNFFTKYWYQDEATKSEIDNIRYKINKELTFCGRVKGVF